MRVCLQRRYDKKSLECSSDDTVLSQGELYTARLSFTGHDGNHFQHDTLTVIISSGSDSTGWQEQGRISNYGASLADSILSDGLASIFVSANLGPAPGTHYQIEVDDGSTLLGTAQFEVTT